MIMKRLMILVISFLLAGSVRAQTTDTLRLVTVIQRVLTLYPSVQQAREALRVAEEKITLSRSARLPVLSGSASYRWMYPISTMQFDDRAFDLGLKNNYDVGVSLSQTLYDFGRNRPKIESARLQEELANVQNEELYQSLALQAIQSYYLTGFSRKAIVIKQEELANYTRLLEEMSVKKETGSATEFDLLNTRVKHSVTETELQTLYANKNSQHVDLSLLADTLVDDRVPLSDVVLPAFPPRTLEDLVKIGIIERPEMIAARKQLDISREEEKVYSRAYNPSLDLSASAGAKNGYLPRMERMKMNYTVGATLTIPIYERGNRRSEKILGQSAVVQSAAAVRLVEKQIENQITGFYNNLKSSQSKIGLLVLQVRLAEEAYRQARTNYAAGAITNLELLTSATNMTNAKLQLEQEKINYSLTFYQLMMATGKNIQE